MRIVEDNNLVVKAKFAAKTAQQKHLMANVLFVDHKIHP